MRWEFPKRSAEVDRVAKNEATRLRNNLAYDLRRQPGGVALLRNAASFKAVVELLRSLLSLDGGSFGGPSPSTPEPRRARAASLKSRERSR